MNQEPIKVCETPEEWVDEYYHEIIELFNILKSHIDYETRFLVDLHKIPSDHEHIYFQRFIEFLYNHSSGLRFTY